jgi:hypothetical protein
MWLVNGILGTEEVMMAYHEGQGLACLYEERIPKK